MQGNKIMGEQGFTLVELMAVLALAGIMLAIGLVGVKGYMSYALYKNNNETAKNIFLDVQTALADKKAAGILDELYEETEELEQRVPFEGYERYSFINFGKDESELNNRNRDILKGLLNGYAADPQIWQGSVCVEADFEDGVVVGVWYAKQAEGLKYAYGEETAFLDDNIFPIGDSKEDLRKFCLGYYGTEPVNAAPKKAERPVIENLNIDNGELLDINWRILEETGNSLEMTYYITFYGGEGEAKMQLMLDGKDLHPGDGLGYAWCSYALFDNKGEILPYSENKINVLCYVGKADYDIHIIADGLDVNGENIFLSKDKGMLKSKEDISSDDLYKTSCGLRFAYICGIDPMDEFFVRVQCVDEKGNMSLKKESPHSCLLMGRGSGKADFTINNGRQLYNLRYIEGLFEYNGEDELNICVEEGFSWGGDDGIIADGNVFNSANFTNKTERAKFTDDEKNLAFSPIYEIKRGSSIYSENNSEIRGLYIKDGALIERNFGEIKGIRLMDGYFTGKNAAAFCVNNFGSLEELEAENTYISGSEAVGGIAGTNEGSVINCSFCGRIFAEGTGCAGGIAGINGSGENIRERAVIENCSLYDPVDRNMSVDVENEYESEDYTIFSASENVGGICGKNNFDGVITGSMAKKCSIRVNNGSVGGVVGFNGGIVKNCFAERDVEGGDVNEIENNANIGGKKLKEFIYKIAAERKVTAYNVRILGGLGYVGGIVGFNDRQGLVANCRTGMDFITVQKNFGGRAYNYGGCGGAIGLNNSDYAIVNIENSGDVFKEFDGEGCIICGGIAGVQAGSGEFSGCINYGNVFGIEYVGGILAESDGKNVKITNCLNYGNIYAKNGAGGIFGLGNGSIKAESCVNFGEIYGSNGGCGGIGGMAKEGIIINKCSNAGYVHGGIAGGILGTVFENAAAGSGVFGCVNYYGFKNGEAAILGANSGNVKINGCFDVLCAGDVPIFADNCGGGVNYYFGRTMADGVEPFKGNGIEEILVYTVNYVWRGIINYGGEDRVIILPYNLSDESADRTPAEVYGDMGNFIYSVY